MLKAYVMFPFRSHYVRIALPSLYEEYEFLKGYLLQGDVAYCVCYNKLIGYYHVDVSLGFVFESV